MTNDQVGAVTEQESMVLPLSKRLREWVYAIVGLFGLFGAIALYGAIFAVYIWPKSPSSPLATLLHEHFRAVVAVPMTAIASFLVIWAFSFTSGRIEISGFGINFKGAAAPVIFWIFVFSAITSAINLSW